MDQSRMIMALSMMAAAGAAGMVAAPQPGHLTREAPPRPKPPRPEPNPYKLPPSVDLRPAAEVKRARKAAKRLKLKGGEA